MELSPDVLDDLQAQLRHVAEQVRALEVMVADGRDCRTIVGQLVAARNDLGLTSFRILSAEATGCLADAGPIERVERLHDLQQMLQRLG